MTWAKLTGEAWLAHLFGSPFVGPSVDVWGQADVWIPPNTLTACGEDGRSDLFGYTAAFIDFGNDYLQAHNVGTALAPDWRWLTDLGNLAATGPTTGATHTIKFHYTSGATFGSGHVDWYVDGALVVSDSGVNIFAQSNLFLNHFTEGCCCEIYYYTNVRVGTSDGGSDLFADDFSGGFANWTRGPVPVFMPSASALVPGPVTAACPTLTVAPPRGLPGEPMTLTGTGFAPDAPLTLWVAALPIESFTGTSDGSGNAHIVTTVPHHNTSGSFSPYDIYLLDDSGNIACATLAVCGTTPADGITTAPDPLVATGGITSNNLILDYIFHDGAHWVLWQDTSQTTELNSTFPPPANHMMNATRISADGSSVVDYPIDTNYRWVFDAGAVDDPFLTSHRDCGGVSVTAPVWSSNFFFSGWEKPINDAHFASDGTSLWVAVLTEETVPYPWLDNLDAVPGQNPGAAAQFTPLAVLTSGFTSFATDAAGGYLRYNTQTDGAVNIYAANAFPVTDAGEADSGYWNPPVVVMFAFDGAAFNRIGEIDALYSPGGTNGISYANQGILSVPHTLQRAPRGGLTGRVAICASPNDPGRCHVVWSEGGDWGRQGLAAADCTRLVWDGGPQNRDYRLNYTTWSPTAKLTDTDLAHSHIDRTDWFFPYDDGLFDVTPWGFTFPDQSEFAGCLSYDLRNDNPAGTPLLFLTWPQSTLGGEGPDGFGNPWLDRNLVYGDTLHVYDLSGGTLALAQEISPALFPDEEECDFVYPNGPFPAASDCLYSAPVISPNYGPQDKAFGISLPYKDPLLGGELVYLVHVPWARRSAGNDLTMRGFYRVPCDMSSDFDFLDGARQLGFTVIKEPFGNPFSGYQGFFYSNDFFSDEKNIWVPAPVTLTNAFGSGFNGYQGEWFDRVCNNQWETFSGAWTPFVSSYWLGSQCPGFYYDPDADSITTVTGASGLEPGGGPLFAVATQFICRGCNGCKCGTGIHLAHRF